MDTNAEHRQTPVTAWTDRVNANTRHKIGAANPLTDNVPAWNQTQFDASIPDNLWSFESAQCWIPLTRHLGATNDDVTYLSDLTVVVRQHVREQEPYIRLMRHLGDDPVPGSNYALTLTEAKELIDVLQAAVALADNDSQTEVE